MKPVSTDSIAPANTISEGSSPIKVATVGLDNRSNKMLSMVFKEKLTGICELVNVDNAQVAIVDMDGANAESSLKQFRNDYNHIPVIVVSIRPLKMDNTVIIRKPIVWPGLLQATRQLAAGDTPNRVNETLIQDNIQAKTTASGEITGAAEAMSARTGSADTATNTTQNGNDNFNSAAFYNPDRHVIGQLIKSIPDAKAAGKSVKLTCWDKFAIVYIPGEFETILTNFSEGKCRTLGLVRTNDPELNLKVEMLDAAALGEFRKANSDSLITMPAENFIWKLSLLTSRGRVPVGIDITTRVYLYHWPNLSRLEPVNNGLRIAALWKNQPRNLVEIADTLNIAKQDVFSFYSAAHNIGLAGPAKRKADNLLEKSATKAHKKRGLFSTLLKKLTGNNEKEKVSTNGSERV